jgi:PAT family beta-lactamase induction signal transducer AmpG
MYGTRAAIFMDVTRPAVAATQFTAYMALLNFSTTIGFLFAARANEWWTYSGVYLVAAAMELTAVALLVFIDPGETRRKLPFPEGTRPPPYGLFALLALLVFLIVMTGYITMQKLG